jgi:protein-disulfide isomerase
MAVLALAGLVPAAAEAKPATKTAATREWSRTVAATPEGGFRMGNPNAKVKLVEYGSLACPHCRQFEQEGYKPLVQGYVRGGTVSYEFRNLLISGPDIAVSLIARCGGPGKFFAMSQYIYATQPQWEKKFADLSDAQKAELDKMSNEERVVRFAEISGLPQAVARFGVAPAKARQCVADQKALKQLLDMTQTAMNSGVAHTPTFVINGKTVEAATWEDLEPLLRQAGGRDASSSTNRSK